ncbi:MAG TPA: LamG-like jellyroll fold domain-containing protein [Streptosporangiaceae bacterium]|nr:LamG-like jellyroll fold domain-containing protein [Streptosporangiaceae bacterium]
MGSSSLVRHARWLRAVGVFVAACSLCGPAFSAPTADAATAAPHIAAGRHHSPVTAGNHRYQSAEQASAEAIRTHKAVPVTSATTPTSTVTANPDGSFTLRESATPVRTRVDGAWKALNPRLIRNINGTWSPKVSTYPLTLSGGGTGPLATMTYGGYSLALTAPMRLPAPSVSGATATYAGVLPGVDLVVTARPSGGYSDVIRIANSRAAANPALTRLTFATRARGLTVTATRGGGLAARNTRGQPIFSAPAPRMWDSAVSPKLRAALASGAIKAGQADRAGFPIRSSAVAPAIGAHTAAVRVSAARNRLTLIPAQALLRRPGAVFPEFIDPNWDAAGSSASNWAYVSSEFPNQPYFDNSDYLQVGEEPTVTGNADTGFRSYAFYQLPISSAIRGATINSATAYFPEVWADSCTASPVDLYQTSKAISSSTTYNNLPGWGAKLGTDNVAFGWSSSGLGGSSSCPVGAQDVHFDIKSLITTDAGITSGAMPTLNVGLRAESAGVDGWKKFANPKTQWGASNATITIQYAFKPGTPALSTSLGTNCSGTAVSGDGNVTLTAAMTDKDGFPPTVSYTAYAAGVTSNTFATNLPASAASSGSGTKFSSTIGLKEADLKTALTKYGPSGTVKITWTATAQVNVQGTVLSSSTATCSFVFSTAKPGPPNVWNDQAATIPCGGTYNIGTPVSFYATGNTTSSVNPDSYIYQLNGGNPVTVAAGSAAPFESKITVTPTRMTNVLSVTAVASGVNVGQAYTCIVNGQAAATAADQDLTGDGVPDLLTVGDGTTGVAPGLWLAPGQGAGGTFDGTVGTTPTDIAPYGAQGTDATGSAPDPVGWNGMKVISGQFLGPGFNAIEAYAPGSSSHPGIYVIPAQGDGSAVTSVLTSQGNNMQGAFDVAPFTDCSFDQAAIPDYPNQLADAYNVSGNTSGGIPDQIGAYTDASLSPFAGQSGFLAYFQADSQNSFDSSDGNLGIPYILTNASPDGTDWSNWTITTSAGTGGGGTMFLWNSHTGALWMWQLTGLSNPTSGGCSSGTWLQPSAVLAGAPVEVDASWHTGALDSLQATAINGLPGLTDVTGAGKAESWTVRNGALVQVPGSPQQLSTADHTYPLNDGTSGAVATATDFNGTAATDAESDLTGNSGVTWHTGDLFSPDATFNGTSGFLTTASGATDFNPERPFTISAWVNPSALGGTVFAQNGSTYSTIKVSSTTGGQWSLGMNTTGSTYVTVNNGTARAGLWTNLTLTYDGGGSAGDGMLRLYANGTEVASLDDTSPPTTFSRFTVGSAQVAGVASDFLAGQVADIQIWDTLAAPVQPTTPASGFVPVAPVRILDTRSASKIGGITGPLGSGATVSVPIAGTTTSSGVTIPAGVTAVALSITIGSQTQTGYVTLYADGEPKPGTSTLDFPASGPLSNNAIIPVGPDGKISIYNYGTATDQILLDLTGYFITPSASSVATSTYHPLANPARILLTTNGTGVPKAQVAAGTSLLVHVEGVTTNGANVPATGVTAVALNIGAIAPSGDNGWVAAYPDGTARPEVSNVSFTGGQTYSCTVIVPVGSDGKIDIYNGSAKPIDLVGDLSGYFTTSASGQYYHPLDAARILDTRQTSNPISSASPRTLTDPAAIIAQNPTLVLNITAVAPANSGYLRAYPGQDTSTGTSILNFPPTASTAGLGLVYTAGNNSFVVANSAATPVNVLLDINGYFQ